MMTEDRSYGVIVVLKGVENKFLLLQQIAGHWGFAKGHLEGDETEKEAAFRELKEEAGITECLATDAPAIFEEYTFNDRDVPCHKIVQYFIGFAKDGTVNVQQEEILGYRWVTYTEAIELFTYDNNKETLKQAKEYLEKLDVIK
jgi:tRNA nucleotidyltransferase (CCA-adding enzyme)